MIRAAFGDHDASSTLPGVCVLGYDDQLVEIDAIPVVPHRATTDIRPCRSEGDYDRPTISVERGHTPWTVWAEAGYRAARTVRKPLSVARMER